MDGNFQYLSFLQELLKFFTEVCNVCKQTGAERNGFYGLHLAHLNAVGSLI